MTKTITTCANANIALIKYWGKRDETLFLPTKSSLSVTLSSLTTTTKISSTTKNQDEITINAKRARGKAGKKIIHFLDLFRRPYGTALRFKIITENNFPTGAGLASSASGFAALALGFNQICHLRLSPRALSMLARQGSGSACRSIFGGFVIWHKGKHLDGQDSFAEQLFPESFWPDFRILVVVIQEQEKKISSREAMNLTVKTSSSYQSWIEESEKRLPLMIKAIKEKNLEKVGELAETDCLGMHQTMHDAHPSINYWQPTTQAIIEAVKELREQKIHCYFTIDAGPNVKIIYKRQDQEKIIEYVRTIKGVKKIITCPVGTGAHLINTQ